MQLNGDLMDLTVALNLDSLKHKHNKLGHPAITRTSCSALLKLMPNDVYVSHVTWSPYSIMLRVLKNYNFPWKIMDQEGTFNVY